MPDLFSPFYSAPPLVTGLADFDCFPHRPPHSRSQEFPLFLHIPPYPSESLPFPRVPLNPCESLRVPPNTSHRSVSPGLISRRGGRGATQTRPADPRRYLDDEPDSEEEAAIRRQEEEEDEAAEAEDYDLRDMGEFERASERSNVAGEMAAGGMISDEPATPKRSRRADG